MNVLCLTSGSPAWRSVNGRRSPQNIWLWRSAGFVCRTGENRSPTLRGHTQSLVHSKTQGEKQWPPKSLLVLDGLLQGWGTAVTYCRDKDTGGNTSGEFSLLWALLKAIIFSPWPGPTQQPIGSNSGMPQANQPEELTHWKRFWCWEALGAGEGDDRGWDGRMVSLTQWTWSWWTPGVGDGQAGLACCDSWGRKESDTNERLDWTEPTRMVGTQPHPLADKLLKNFLSMWLPNKHTRWHSSAHLRDKNQFHALVGRNQSHPAGCQHKHLIPGLSTRGQTTEARRPTTLQPVNTNCNHRKVDKNEMAEYVWDEETR